GLRAARDGHNGFFDGNTADIETGKMIDAKGILVVTSVFCIGQNGRETAEVERGEGGTKVNVEGFITLSSQDTPPVTQMVNALGGQSLIIWHGLWTNIGGNSEHRSRAKINTMSTSDLGHGIALAHADALRHGTIHGRNRGEDAWDISGVGPGEV